MKNIDKLDPKILASISRKMSEMARVWPDDDQSNRLSRLADKLLRLPRVELEADDYKTIEFYLENR